MFIFHDFIPEANGLSIVQLTFQVSVSPVPEVSRADFQVRFRV